MLKISSQYHLELTEKGLLGLGYYLTISLPPYTSDSLLSISLYLPTPHPSLPLNCFLLSINTANLHTEVTEVHIATGQMTSYQQSNTLVFQKSLD